MASADESMPVRGKGRGKAEPSGKKPEKRARKPRQKADQPLVEAQEQTDAPMASVESSPAETAVIDVAPVAAAESSPAETVVIDVAPIAPAEGSRAETVAIDVAPVAPAESSPAETVVVDVAPVAAAESAAVDAAPLAPAATAPVDPVVPTQPAPAPDPVSYQAITNAYGDYTRKSIEQTSSFFEQLAGARSFNRALQLQTEYARLAYETFIAESRKIRELHSELNRQRLQRFESLVTGTKATRSS